jgi:hypothetical protein
VGASGVLAPPHVGFDPSTLLGLVEAEATPGECPQDGDALLHPLVLCLGGLKDLLHDLRLHLWEVRVGRRGRRCPRRERQNALRVVQSEHLSDDPAAREADDVRSFDREDVHQPDDVRGLVLCGVGVGFEVDPLRTADIPWIEAQHLMTAGNERIHQRGGPEGRLARGAWNEDHRTPAHGARQVVPEPDAVHLDCRVAHDSNGTPIHSRRTCP